MTAGGREWGKEERRSERGSRLSRTQTRSQTFTRASEPLAARAARRGTRAQREPVQGGRGAAAAAVHAAGSGCPAPGTTRGEVRRGGRRPLRDADRQVSRAARAACPLRSARTTPARPLLPLGPPLDRRADGRGAVGRSGCVWVAAGLRPHQTREARGAWSVRTAAPPSLTSLPGGFALSRWRQDSPLRPPNLKLRGPATLAVPESGPALSESPQRAPASAHPARATPLQARLPPAPGRRAGRSSLGRRASSPSLGPRPRRFLESLKSVCLS